MLSALLRCHQGKLLYLASSEDIPFFHGQGAGMPRILAVLCSGDIDLVFFILKIMYVVVWL